MAGRVIESEKLKAIGLGNRVEHEKEVRKRKQVRQAGFRASSGSLAREAFCRLPLGLCRSIRLALAVIPVRARSRAHGSLGTASAPLSHALPRTTALPSRARPHKLPRHHASQVELQAMINEKKTEMERLNIQLDSLGRVEADQKALIEKLKNNEA